MSKHTPGPWEAHHRHVYAKHDDDEIAGLGWEITGPDKPIRGMVSKAADAHIIAAAPEMLAELKFLRSWLVWSNQMQQDVIVCEGNIGREKLDALIAKAEGRS